VPIVETLGDGGANTLSLTLNQGGMAKGDLAPRADGTRRYAFYGETLTLAQ
jgi:hypothetical protein